MSSECVLLFSGQGAQKVGMGKDLYEASASAKGLMDRADEVLGFSLTRVMFEGPIEELTRTSHCQPALYVHGLACLAALRERDLGLAPQAAAGLSLGEFTAHAAAGTFSFEDGLRLVHRRGIFMEEACEATEGGMAAMIGGSEEAVRSLAEACDVDVANLNAPGQIVISGAKSKVAEAVAKAKESGIRMAKELVVAGAYHSRLMRSAQEKLAVELADIQFRTPDFPVIANLTAKSVADAAAIREALEKQVTGSVRWSDSMAFLLGEGNRLFVELGPGGVLAGLMGRIDKGAEVLPAGDLESIEATAGRLKDSSVPGSEPLA